MRLLIDVGLLGWRRRDEALEGDFDILIWHGCIEATDSEGRFRAEGTHATLLQLVVHCCHRRLLLGRYMETAPLGQPVLPGVDAIVDRLLVRDLQLVCISL